MVLQARGNARIYRSLVQLACGQFDHLITNLFSYSEFLEANSQRRNDVPLGVSDSALFHRMRSYPTFAQPGKITWPK